MSWQEQIQKFLYSKRGIYRNDTLILGNLQSFLLNDGISNKVLAVPQRVVTKAMKGKDAFHSIKRSKIAQLDKGVNEAPIVIVNPERNAIVYVTNVRQGGLPIVVAFDMDAEFDRDPVHQATSMHLQADTMSMLKALPESATVYVQKENELSAVGATNNLRGLAAKTKFIGHILPDVFANVNPEKYSADDKDAPQYHSPYGIYMPGTPGVGDSNLANKKITAEMSDAERAEILSNKTIVAPHYNGEADTVIAGNAEDLYSREMGLVKKAVQRIYQQFQIGSILFNPDMDIVVEVSNGTMKESAKKQVTDPAQLSKVLPLLEQAVEGAVGIECHDNRYYGDYQTEDFAVLLGGYVDENRFVPVRFGIKRGKDGHNTLYVVVSADAIDISDVESNKKEVEVVKTPTNAPRANHDASRSTSTVSIYRVIENVNSKNVGLLNPTMQRRLCILSWY